MSPASAFRNGRAGFHRTDLRKVAAETTEELSEATGMNAALSVLDSDSLLYLRTADHVSVRYAARAGNRAPLHCMAAGKVFLAHMPRSQFDAFLASSNLEKFTEFTRTNPEVFETDFPAILENGYATVVKEEFLQVMGMSAPI